MKVSFVYHLENRKTYTKGLLGIKYVFLSCLNVYLLVEIFTEPINIKILAISTYAPNAHRNILRSSRSVSYCYLILTQIEMYRQFFMKCSNTKFLEFLRENRETYMPLGAIL
jgi:hypothetical protein